MISGFWLKQIHSVSKTVSYLDHTPYSPYLFLVGTSTFLLALILILLGVRGEPDVTIAAVTLVIFVRLDGSSWKTFEG